MKILFSASEIYPLAKTGGLGDVVFSLSNELKNLAMIFVFVQPQTYRSHSHIVSGTGGRMPSA